MKYLKEYSEVFIDNSGNLNNFSFFDSEVSDYFLNDYSEHIAPILINKISNYYKKDITLVKIELFNKEHKTVHLEDVQVISSFDNKNEYLVHLTSEVPVIENTGTKTVFKFKDKDSQEKWINKILIIDVETI
jgi:hypothetical protein